MILIGAAYGFYIITSDDGIDSLDKASYPYQTAYLVDMGDESDDDEDALNSLINREPEPAIQLLSQDDLEYMDRANRLQNSLRNKRAIIELADEYNQNILPDDLDGIRLVRSSLPQEHPQDYSMPAHYLPFQKRVPMSYIVIE
uniref:Uncharacterized protein n=1 Tax=Acrobeloides nanus TaxID=290746 RepID=A0A914CPQ6_9BILA